MNINQTHENSKTLPNKKFALKTPSRVFRFGWLAVGLILGYIVSLFDLHRTVLLALLATLAGASANWSA